MIGATFCIYGEVSVCIQRFLLFCIRVSSFEVLSRQTPAVDNPVSELQFMCACSACRRTTGIDNSHYDRSPCAEACMAHTKTWHCVALCFRMCTRASKWCWLHFRRRLSTRMNWETPTSLREIQCAVDVVHGGVDTTSNTTILYAQQWSTDIQPNLSAR